LAALKIEGQQSMQLHSNDFCGMEILPLVRRRDAALSSKRRSVLTPGGVSRLPRLWRDGETVLGCVLLMDTQCFPTPEICAPSSMLIGIGKMLSISTIFRV
jgi:hypothetical protein